MLAPTGLLASPVGRGVTAGDGEGIYAEPKPDIITPPDAVIILHQGAFCLLSVFTGSVHSFRDQSS